VYRALSIVIVLILSFISTFRIPESDLENYIYYYNLFSDFSFFDALSFSGKDPLYNLFVYAISQFSQDSIFFQFIITFTFYFLNFSTIKLLKISDKFKFFIFLSIALNPLIYSIHLHLIRQFLAYAILILSVFSINKYKSLFLGSISIGTHFSFILVWFLSLFKFNLKRVVIFIGMMLFVNLTLEYFKSLTILSYLFKRASGNFLDFGTLSLSQYIISIILFYVSAISFVSESFYLNTYFKRINLILHSILITSLFVNTELFYRVFPICIVSLHFVFFDLYAAKKNIISYSNLIFVNSILLVTFVYSIFNGRWLYQF
jgi:hypothetical protein